MKEHSTVRHGLRVLVVSIALMGTCCAWSQSGTERPYTLLVPGTDTPYKVKLLIEALHDVDPNATLVPEDPRTTRIIRIESAQPLSLPLINARLDAAGLHATVLAHGAAPVEVLQGAANITGEPYLLETGDPDNDRFRYEDARQRWNAAHPASSTTHR